ncbi:polar amino acid transport system substrate-binding protein [Mariprofundus micogutta]|uniref:Polar amino acid transport system substrate-binding protein n=1 Tax=Mariprofundus micogutta TaxID=1921010 RepID=A0A1L8CNA4_9PROT|nr:transporter substrate-binding domain-containing protein [Mariprofundus micogutta]GAV20374.1 polar amino acid transport system substrate-binding protein [Mariprofundus micogutta]
MQRFAEFIFAAAALAILLPGSAQATGPRVTTALFSPDKNEVHAVDFPPFVTEEVVDGGPISEIVRIALKRAKLDAVITTHPLKRMVRYYLLQEDALAVMGWHFQFSKEQRKQLIFVPISGLSEKFFYYKPAYPNGLNLNEAGNLKGKHYGAHKGEEKSYFAKAGAEVHFGRTITMLKKLRQGDLDFICAPPQSVEWLVDRYMPEEKGRFISTEAHAEHQVYFIVFNRKHPSGEVAAEKFKQALSAMVSDGTSAAISKKHFGDSDNGKMFLRRLETFK